MNLGYCEDHERHRGFSCLGWLGYLAGIAERMNSQEPK